MTASTPSAPDPNISPPREYGATPARRKLARRVRLVFATAVAGAAGWMYGQWILKSFFTDSEIFDNHLVTRVAAAALRERRPEIAAYIDSHFTQDKNDRLTLLKYAIRKRELDFALGLYRKGVGKGNFLVEADLAKLADGFGRASLADQLLQRRPLTPDELLMDACRKGSISDIKAALAKGADFRRKEEACISNAANKGHADVIDYFVREHGFGSAPDDWLFLESALTISVTQEGSAGTNDVTAYLLKKFDFPDTVLQAASVFACDNDNLDAFKALYKKNPAAIDLDVMLIRAMAAPMPIEFVQFILQHGGRITPQNNDRIASGLAVWAYNHSTAEDPAAFVYQRKLVTFMLAQGLKYDGNLAVAIDESNKDFPDFVAQVRLHDAVRTSAQAAELQALKPRLQMQMAEPR